MRSISRRRFLFCSARISSFEKKLGSSLSSAYRGSLAMNFRVFSGVTSNAVIEPSGFRIRSMAFLLRAGVACREQIYQSHRNDVVRFPLFFTLFQREQSAPLGSAPSGADSKNIKKSGKQPSYPRYFNTSLSHVDTAGMISPTKSVITRWYASG